MTSTHRVAAFRARQRNGSLSVPSIAVTADHVDALITAKVLAAWDSEDPAEVGKAIVRLLDHLARDDETPFQV
jgi:hypothetical protein